MQADLSRCIAQSPRVHSRQAAPDGPNRRILRAETASTGCSVRIGCDPGRVIKRTHFARSYEPGMAEAQPTSGSCFEELLQRLTAHLAQSIPRRRAADRLRA